MAVEKLHKKFDPFVCESGIAERSAELRYGEPIPLSSRPLQPRNRGVEPINAGEKESTNMGGSGRGAIVVAAGKCRQYKHAGKKGGKCEVAGRNCHDRGSGREMGMEGRLEER